jgi:hypothetical protein
MPDNNEEKNEEIKVDVEPPNETPKPDGIVTTKKPPIKRTEPLRETHGMTIESERFVGN